MVDEQDTVQMIDLVLQTGRQKSVGIDGLLIALPIEIAHRDGGRPFDIGVIVRNGQASLFVNTDIIAGGHHLRVDEDLRVLRIVFARDVDHQKPARDADLNCRKADPRRVIHGFEHVLDKPVEFRVNALHRLAFLAQYGIGQEDEGLDGHEC